jgi:hypothetical protein
MKIEIIDIIPGEVCHHYNIMTDDLIVSMGPKFFGRVKGACFEFEIPVHFTDLLMTKTRYLRRISRRDKSNCILNWSKNGLIVIYLGVIYYYDLRLKKLSQTLKMNYGRNLLHQSIAVSDGLISFGEYFSNKDLVPVTVWHSKDDGISWYEATKLAGIRHVHGVYKDSYSRDLWITTGDFDDQCFLYQVIDGEFDNVIKYGDGSQNWRAVSLNFDKNYIFWGMDSPIADSYLVYMNRKDKSTFLGPSMPGPVWYSKTLVDGGYLFGTSVEPGPSVKSNLSSVYYLTDSNSLNCIGTYRKDILNGRLFKFGVVGFADGDQSKNNFIFFGEALSNIDGKIFRAKIT